MAQQTATEQAPATVEQVEGQLYTPAPGESQLTVRAVAAGCLLGGLVTGMNLYLGLKIGWTVGGSLMAAILGFAFFTVINPKKKFSVLECNITQTAGSGAGTMASAGGMVAPIPAMMMMDYEIPIWGLFLWTLSIAYLGVMFAVPLRRQYVVIEKLRFPTGTATANTIVSMFATAGEAVAKARVLLYFGVFSFVYIIVAHFFHQLENPLIHEWVGSASLAFAATWGFSLYCGPMLFGAGFLIGPRVGASLFAGAVVGWAVLGYLAQQKGWAPHPNPQKIHDSGVTLWEVRDWFDWLLQGASAPWKDTSSWGPRGWILWPGVAIMVSDAIGSLLLNWRTFITAFKGTKDAVSGNGPVEADADAIPNSWWIKGLAFAAVSTVIVAYFVFAIPPYMSIFAIIMSAILANVAVRSTGETDINPVGGMGKVTQLAFGAISSSPSINLMSAGITGAGASQAGDMMQDLKTGYMLGASPRKQFISQLWGIAAGVCFAVPVYLLFDSAYDIGGEGSRLGAPAAVAWKAVAEVMSKGFGALPPHAVEAIIGGLIFGGSIPVLKKLFPKIAPFLPSGLAFGIAFIVPAFYSITMFLGSMALIAWNKKNKAGCERMVFAVACGLVAGEGLGGIVNAVLTILGVG